MVATRFPVDAVGGVNNAALQSTLQTFVGMDPTAVYSFFDDFQAFRGASNQDWLVTNANSGTLVVQDENFGVLLVSNTVGDNRFVSAQWEGFKTGAVAEIFKIDTTKDLWFKTRFKLSDVIESDALIGLLTTNVDPITAVVDGIYFLKPDDAATLQLKLTKNSTSTTVNVGTLVNNTYVTCGFHYTPLGTVTIYLNDVRVASAAVTNLIDDEEITPTFTIQNGAGVTARTMSLDYIFAAVGR